MTKLQEKYLLEILSGNLKILEYGLWIDGIEYEGLYKYWYKNGQIQKRRFYKNGLLNGEYKSWYNNGQICEYSFCKDGKLDGEYKLWNKNGQIQECCFFKNGMIQ